MFTPAQVSEMTDVAPSTLRKYVAQFRRQFSENAQQQRGRRFTEQDVAMINQIRQLFAKGFSSAEISQRLEAGFLPQDAESISAMVAFSDQSAEKEQVVSRLNEESLLAIKKDFKHELKQVYAELTAIQDKLVTIQERQARQWETIQFEVTQIKAALNRIKADQQAQAERTEKIEKALWWKRLFKKKKL